jgi:hypothetical protein
MIQLYALLVEPPGRPGSPVLRLPADMNKQVSLLLVQPSGATGRAIVKRSFAHLADHVHAHFVFAGPVH